MARTIIGELIVRLTDGVTGKAKQVVGAINQIDAAARRAGTGSGRGFDSLATSLKRAELAAKGLAASGTAIDSWGSRFQGQLARLRASASDIDRVRDSWRRLQADLKAGNFDNALRTSAVKAWKAETIASLMAVRREAQATSGMLKGIGGFAGTRGMLNRMSQAVAMSRPMTGYAPYLTTGFGLYKAHHDLLEWSAIQNQLRAANPDESEASFKGIEKSAVAIADALKIVGRADVLKGANTLMRAGQSAQSVAASLEPIAKSALVTVDRNVAEMAGDLVQLANINRMATRTAAEARQTYTTLGELGTYVNINAPGTFKDWVEGMKKVSSAVTLTPDGLKTVTQLYTLLDKAGIKGAEAGVNIRQLYRHLAAPRRDALQMYAQLGIDTDRFLLRGKPASAADVVRAVGSAFGKDIEGIEPQIQEAIAQGAGTEKTSQALYKLISDQFGKLKPNDARKLKKSIDDTLRSTFDQIDVAKWFDIMREKGLTLGQAIKLLEPRQAAKTLTAIRDAHGDQADAMLATPLGTLPGFQPGMLDRSAEEMTKRYAGAVGRLQQAWTSILAAMEDAGAIDRLAAFFERIGSAIQNIAKGQSGVGDYAWLAGAAAAPFAIKPLIQLLLQTASAATAAAGGIAALLNPISAIAGLLGVAGLIRKHTGLLDPEPGASAEPRSDRSVAERRRQAWSEERQRLGLEPLPELAPAVPLPWARPAGATPQASPSEVEAEPGRSEGPTESWRGLLQWLKNSRKGPPENIADLHRQLAEATQQRAQAEAVKPEAEGGMRAAKAHALVDQLSERIRQLEAAKPAEASAVPKASTAAVSPLQDVAQAVQAEGDKAVAAAESTSGRIGAAMAQPIPADAARSSMQQFISALQSGGEQAVATVSSFVERIKSMLNFSASPHINVQTSVSGGGGAGAGGGGAAAPSAPGRASGGSVYAGSLYRINEYRDEGFVPAEDGTIIPNLDRGGRGGGGTRGPISVSLSFAPMSFHGIHDVSDVTARVQAELEDKLGDMIRGLFPDYGVESA